MVDLAGPPADAEGVPPLEESAEELYEQAPCGYLSTRPDGTIIRVNQTLLRWTGYASDEVCGRPFQELLTPGGRIYHETHYRPLLLMQGAVREIAVELVRADGGRLPVLLNSVLKRDGAGAPEVVRTSVFDATDRRAYEHELLEARQRAEASESRARELARTLQESLIPPAPPQIPGLDVAGAYRPAGRGDEVGGDFYDVFETARGDWAVVVGDVQGKGAQAAAVTALVRYTLRAASMRTRRPKNVLTRLNQALVHQHAERFCTVVYARVQLQRHERARVTVASAGHALPVLVGAAGGVHEVGRPGTLLGVLDTLTLHETSRVLAPGESLVFYTDGVTEASAGGSFFGEEGLWDVLDRTRGAPAAGVAQEIVDAVVDYQAGVTRDDVTLVVVRHPA